ncbi:hypothetical protein PGT21_004774 [Puccinia graminis f. sp. tritici]|uniref:Uncharacterized protein n=1 Tax=Puccinia graminis f. sp. tritici TaxID=56615 RepID=A0A5B0P8Q2_PUCGR|nr:hypothetical protein PGTUg99_019487 [Puccinia graminis f. sp. tritici]KAA1097383.1 hypothetical protein PGT21_004774 [Puccinia graminis f. sp. tritici]KAA1134265.1 hypothetical protein PGTUg99_034245 [Puccinia graminis f. sp. tritici]
MKSISIFLIVCALACFSASNALVLRPLSYADLKIIKTVTRRPRPNTQAFPARPRPRPYNSLNRENGHPPPHPPPPAPHPKSSGLHGNRHWGSSLTPAGDDEGRTYG